MGLFQKNAASKLFSSSFAIESDKKDKSESSKEVDLKKAMEEIVADEPLLNQIEAENIESALGENSDVEDLEGLNADTKSLSISQIIQLVRSLPQQGTEIELHAVLRTLELFDIDIRNVLEDSYRKESVTAQRIDTLLSEIDTLDEEIDKRAKEIKILEIGITEMVRVNECLELMLKLDDELLEAEHEELMREDESSDTPDYTADEANGHDGSSPDKADSQMTILSSKSKAVIDKLDDYVKEGKTQTLDGIVIDLDTPPKKQKLKLPKKTKTNKRKSKTAAAQEA